MNLFHSFYIFYPQVMDKLNLEFVLLIIFKIGYICVIIDFNFQTFSVSLPIVCTQRNWLNQKNILLIMFV